MDAFNCKSMHVKHLLSILEHPDYEASIDDVINSATDTKLIDDAIHRTKNKSRAEALYVLLKLKGIK